MSDYDDDRNRFRNRYNDEDFDYEGGYGRRFDEDRGAYGRGMDYERGYYGRGSDFDRGSYGQGYSRYGQNRGQMNRRGSGQDWDYERGNYPRSGYGQGFDRNFGSAYDYNRGMYGRGMDYDRGYYNQDYWQNYGRTGQNRGQFDRGYSGQSNLSRRGYNQGYGYNRGYNPTDWDTDYDADFDTDFEPTEFTYMEFWMIPGPETGRGPQGYQRSDDRIKEDVCDRLMQHGQIDASEMSVDVQNREVTLSGTVNNRKAKRMAEDMAESVPGVTNVHNQLKVRQGERQSQGRGQRQTEGVGQMQQSQTSQMGQSGQMGMTGQTGQQSEKR